MCRRSPSAAAASYPVGQELFAAAVWPSSARILAGQEFDLCCGLGFGASADRILFGGRPFEMELDDTITLYTIDLNHPQMPVFATYTRDEPLREIAILGGPYPAGPSGDCCAHLRRGDGLGGPVGT